MRWIRAALPARLTLCVAVTTGCPADESAGDADEDAVDTESEGSADDAGPTGGPGGDDDDDDASDDDDDDASGDDDDDADDDGGNDSDDDDDDDTGEGGSTDDGGPPTVSPFQGLCFESPPEGAEAPAPVPAYSGGACPQLVPGWNTISTEGGDRNFILVVPSDVEPDERLPVAFMWHWLGGDPEDFLEIGGVQAAADHYRVAAMIPEDKGDLLFRWPITPIDPDSRVQEELTFFDDMLACFAESYELENNCVTSLGVSAGGLWTPQIAGERGDLLSSFISLSGGTGGLVKPWPGSSHRMPALVLWGGEIDFCIAIDFQVASLDLEMNLEVDGHAVLECIHNCGHGEPPWDVPEGSPDFAPMWEFWLDHPFWLEDGESPWDAGVPESVPEWCSMGAFSAEPREGECGPSQC